MGKNPKRPGGTPPRQHQFRPGESGNPGGRPKKKRTMRDAIDAALERMVEANVDGQRQSMPLKDALAHAFLSKIAGDPEIFIRAMRWLEGETPPGASADIERDADADEDAAIFEAAVARAARRLPLADDREDADD